MVVARLGKADVTVEFYNSSKGVTSAAGCPSQSLSYEEIKPILCPETKGRSVLSYKRFEREIGVRCSSSQWRRLWRRRGWPRTGPRLRSGERKSAKFNHQVRALRYLASNAKCTVKGFIAPLEFFFLTKRSPREAADRFFSLNYSSYSNIRMTIVSFTLSVHIHSRCI